MVFDGADVDAVATGDAAALALGDRNFLASQSFIDGEREIAS